ncbi:hypothetical protein [Actibacterium sp. MT2.3-13A]|uniref:hypothetical protein n=1 Tax=Actibacterium sp. MT2.3-13A TaxID=2828332 RepID=UPI001BA96EA9|nr:hypothetical protein [Actibacterium sp. MT2.3-13A]
MTRIFLAFFLSILPAIAQAEEAETFRIGNDAFIAGSTVVHSGDGADDLFMAGETVRVAAPISGSAHLAGRRVEIGQSIGGDLYAAGMDVVMRGALGGDATVSGYSVEIRDAVGEDLRASGANLTIAGPVAGTALLAGDIVRLESVISGDVYLSGRQVEFGPEARIGGALTLVSDAPEKIEVPAHVLPEDRITRREMAGWQREMPPMGAISWGQVIWRALVGVVVTAALVALIAAVLPGPLAGMRRRLLAAPWRALWFGFLGLSTMTGAAVLLAMTLIGMVLSSAVLLLAVLLGVAGYFIAVYAFGVGLMMAAGRAEPDSLADRALAGALGALAAGLIGLVPLLGWLFVFALALAGAGGLILRWLRPAFFSN